MDEDRVIKLRNSCYQIPFSVNGLAPSQPPGTGRGGLWERAWLHTREKLSDVYPGCQKFFSREHSRPQSYSAHDGQGGKSSGEPWNKIVSDWF